jgi:putative ABC transport system ATP-binding protein
MISLNQVSKTYRRHGNSIAALRPSTLHIQPGEYVAIIGPSGSGKTTLLSILGGMMAPTSGQLILGGKSVYDLSVADRTRLRGREVGFIFQTFNLVPYLTALENVQVPLYLLGLSKEQQARKAQEVLARVGLEERLHHHPFELSVGQQQRVALARTLAHGPSLVLADEPTGNLDPETREQVLAMFDEIHHDGRTLIVVTHDPIVAQRAKRIVRLVDGQMLDSSCNDLRETA